MKSITILIILLLFIGCKSEKEWNKEELEIVSTYINKKLLVESISSPVNDKYFEILEQDSTKHYSLDEQSELIEKIENEVAKRKYYITISDTLFSVNPDYLVHGLTDTQGFQSINESIFEYRKINLKNLKIRNNLILVSSPKGIDRSIYLGSYKISRVIFGKNERAFIGGKTIIDNKEYFRTMTEFKKVNGKWVIKDRFPL